jgi:hypothetical protein
MAAISMLNILGKNEKFIGIYFIALIPYLVPSMPIHTIKKEILWQALFPVSIMIFCFWIIADGADMKVFEQQVSLHPCF